MNVRLRPRRDIVIPAAIVLAVMTALLVFTFVRDAGAQTELVDDYANYPDTPQAQLPDGCDGGGLYHSETYSLTRGGEVIGGPVSDPKLLPEFEAGDTLTMSWDATTSFCVGAPVVLDVKVSLQSFFDPGDDQPAYVPYAVVYATGGPQTLTFTFPDLEPFGHGCAYQLDAIVGLPLAIVGPSGSDYSAPVRGDDRRTTLIGYRNGAYGTCTPTPTTTTTSSTTPTPTSSTSTSVPVPSTVPATAETTPTCAGGGDQSLLPAAAACVLSGNATAEASGADATSAGVRPASPLPTTGAPDGLLLVGAVVLILVGSGVVHIGRKAGRS